MKELLTISLAVLAFIACSKSNIPNENRAETAIAFGEPETRAEITDKNQILKFGVFADKNTGDPGSEGASQFTDFLFTDEEVFRSEESKDWDYVNKQYWIYDREYHFFAYYPYTKNVERKTITENQVDTDVYQIPFTTPANADTDLLTAYVHVSTNSNDPNFEGIPEYVNFSFNHALAKICVTVAKNGANDGDRIVVTSVSFSGIKKSGVYNCHRHANTNEWILSDGNETGTFSMNNLDAELPAGVNGIAVMGDKGMLLIPQTTSSVNIAIKYEFYNYNNTTGNYEYAYANTIESPLPAGEWLPSKSYNYKINLAAEENEILFGTPTITDWGSEKQVGGNIIIQ